MKHVPRLRKAASYPFDIPPTLREYARAIDKSYATVLRIYRSGAMRVVQSSSGLRIDTDWANRYVRSGFTPDEGELYRAYIRKTRRRPEAPSLSNGNDVA